MAISLRGERRQFDDGWACYEVNVGGSSVTFCRVEVELTSTASTTVRGAHAGTELSPYAVAIEARRAKIEKGELPTFVGHHA